MVKTCQIILELKVQPCRYDRVEKTIGLKFQLVWKFAWNVPLNGTLNVNFQLGLKFIPGWIQLYLWSNLYLWLHPEPSWNLTLSLRQYWNFNLGVIRHIFPIHSKHQFQPTWYSIKLRQNCAESSKSKQNQIKM